MFIFKICPSSRHCCLRRQFTREQLGRNILKATCLETKHYWDWLRSYQRACVISAAVIRSDPVIPWYTNPVPWHIFRFPWGALSTSPRTADIFPLQESDICHVFSLVRLSNLYTEKTLKQQMLQFSRYCILEKWNLFLFGRYEERRSYSRSTYQDKL